MSMEKTKPNNWQIVLMLVLSFLSSKMEIIMANYPIEDVGIKWEREKEGGRESL